MQSTDTPGALAGIRVLELGRVLPAELPGMFLADMGADVLKIDAPGPSLDSQAERAAVFVHTNRNKRSMALDLKAAQGAEIFHALAVNADVIIEGFRPGVMKRLGADYESIRAANPRIVYCSLSGFGQDGPYRNHPAHDLNFISMAGVLGLIGEPDRKPPIPLNLIADYGGASMHAALGIVLALFARERTGEGQYIDVSYLDTTISLLAAAPTLRHVFSEGQVPVRGAGVHGGSYPNYAVYGTRDGKLISIACTEPRLWENFCRAIDRPQFAAVGRKPEHYLRAANAEETAAKEEIERIMKTRDRDDWYETLTKHDVCVGKAYEVQEMIRDPQVVHRKMVTEIVHPRFGRIRQFGLPIKFSGTPGSIRSAAPVPGEHTADVLREMGVSPEEIVLLRESGIVGSA